MKRSKQFDKAKLQRWHCKGRFKKRHGIDFNRNVRRFFLDEIKTGRANMVQQQTNRTFVWDVTYEGKVYRVIYDKQRHNIVTVLDNDENGNPVDVVHNDRFDIQKEQELSFEERFEKYKENVK